jgi:hypothetical protein
MKFWLMLVLCMPGADKCTVTWSETKAIYPDAQMCEVAARSMLNWPEMYPYVEGAFCEMSDKKPRTYIIDKGDLP